MQHLPNLNFGSEMNGCHISGTIEVNKVSGKLQYSLLHRAHVHPDGRLHDETSKSKLGDLHI